MAFLVTSSISGWHFVSLCKMWAWSVYSRQSQPFFQNPRQLPSAILNYNDVTHKTTHVKIFSVLCLCQHIIRLHLSILKTTDIVIFALNCSKFPNHPHCCHFGGIYNNHLFGSCSLKAGLDNVTYTYTYYKIHKIWPIYVVGHVRTQKGTFLHDFACFKPVCIQIHFSRRAWEKLIKIQKKLGLVFHIFT